VIAGHDQPFPGDALNLDLADRRRLLFAAAVTVIALPTVWLFTRSESSTGTASSTVAAAGPDDSQSGSADDLGEGVFGTEGPIFVDGPTTPPKPAVVQIVVPAQVEEGHLDGRATYQRTIGDRPDSCSAPNAPFGKTLTVTNRDNGRWVTCVNRAPQQLGKGLEIMLTFDQFSQIAQLIDAPVPVRITWQGDE
jgi:hypothetical protein